MGKRNDSYLTVVNTTGKSLWMSNGNMWQHPVLIRDVMCPDGKYRTAYLGQKADTFFSWPARVKYDGKWHTGFVMTQTDDGFDSGTPLHQRFHENRPKMPEGEERRTFYWMPPSVESISTEQHARAWAMQLSKENRDLSFYVWDRTHNADYCVFERDYFNREILPGCKRMDCPGRVVARYLNGQECEHVGMDSLPE